MCVYVYINKYINIYILYIYIYYLLVSRYVSACFVDLLKNTFCFANIFCRHFGSFFCASNRSP